MQIILFQNLGEFYTVTMDPVELIVNDSNIWWPNGYGEQKLHDVDAYVYSDGSTSEESLLDLVDYTT